MHQSIPPAPRPPRADPWELAFFLPWMANSRGRGLLSWQKKKRSEILNGNISEERIYVTFWNNYPQSTTGKREQSGVRSTWETAGTHSGVDDFSVTSYRLALLLTARSLTFPYLNVLVSCLSSLACASNAAHWRNNRRDMSVSIYSSQITVFWFSQLICLISSLNWLFETAFKRCYGSVIIIITIVHNTWNGKIRPPLHTFWWHKAVRYISEAGLFNVCQ